MKNTVSVMCAMVLMLLTSVYGAAVAQPQDAGPSKYEPPAGKVIVFVGQDNASVGGNGSYTDGYVDNVDVPGGITHYVYFSPEWKNKFGYTFPAGKVGGLNEEMTWAAGPMCLRAYLESPKLKNCLIHLSIAMEGNNEDKVADGTFDPLIKELAAFLKEFADRAFLIRIGYEFDGPWNGYDPDNFKKAFRRIVDHLREANVDNFATVMASSGGEKEGTWEKYYPGDDYVDWVGYSYWGGQGKQALAFARQHHKPAFIAESTPRGKFLDRMDGQEAWSQWFEKYFKHIQDNLDVIRAVSYINCNWDVQPMWTGNGWGNTRVEANAYVKEKWLEQMQKPIYINAKDKPMSLIDFKKP